MKSFPLAAASALLLAGCGTMDDDVVLPPSAAAAPQVAAAAASVSAEQYAMATYSSNLLEIEKSRLALQRSQNPAIRDFAQRMIDDHTRLMGEAEPVFRQRGLDPARMQMSARHRQMLQRLQSVPAAEFDRTYHEVQEMAHQEALTLQRDYAANGDDPQLRALAARAAPVIEAHWNMLQQHRQHMMQAPYRAGERG